MIITSQAEGAIASKGWPYGPGKSTLAGWLLHDLYVEYYGYDDETAWDHVKENFGYSWVQYREILERGMNDRRLGGMVIDDLQHIAGKDKAHNRGVQWTAKTLTTKRPYCAVFLGTCTQLGDLAAAWRSVFLFEFKVYDRGKYEVQYIKTKTRFDDPENPRKLLDIKTVPPVHGKFGPLPPEIQKWYTRWRHENNIDAWLEGWDRYFNKDMEPATDIDERILTATGFREIYREEGLRGENKKIDNLYERFKPLIVEARTAAGSP